MDPYSQDFVGLASIEFSTVEDESYFDTGSSDDDQNYCDHSDTKGSTDDEDESDHSDAEIFYDDRDESDLSDSSESGSIYQYDRNGNDESTSGDADLIPTHALRLEKMASVSVAIALWNHATVSFPDLQPDKAEYRRSLFDQVPKWTDQLQIPKSLAKYIENQFNDIVFNVYYWTYFHTVVIKIKTDLYPHTSCIVWYPNGAINNYETALNLMKLDELDDEEKYRLACTYCMKKEIKKYRKILIGNPMLDVEIDRFYRDPLVTYWNCYYAGKLYMLPVEGNLSIDAFMMRQMYFINWPAVEYFFDLMNIKEQVASTIYMINQGCIEYQKLMLMKMNEFQRMQILANKAVQIIRNYAPFGGPDISDPIIISTWYEVRDLISPNRFVKLMKALCSSKPAPSNAVLTEIWTSSYQEFKNQIFKMDGYDFIGHVLRWACRKRGYGYDFLFAVLADAHNHKAVVKPQTGVIPERKKLFFYLYDKLILKRDFASVTRLRNFKQILIGGA